MRHKTPKNFYRPLFNFVTLVLHAVEKHKEVFVFADKWIELRV
jgi:hypothetical protein